VHSWLPTFQTNLPFAISFFKFNLQFVIKCPCFSFCTLSLYIQGITIRQKRSSHRRLVCIGQLFISCSSTTVRQSCICYSIVYNAKWCSRTLRWVATQEQFPHRVVPNSKTFTSTVQWLRDTGKFHPRTEDRSQRVLDVEPQILETVEANPGRSTRRLAPQAGLSHHVVCAIAHFK
jgi:hypothetical protein